MGGSIPPWNVPTRPVWLFLFLRHQMQKGQIPEKTKNGERRTENASTKIEDSDFVRPSRHGLAYHGFCTVDTLA